MDFLFLLTMASAGACSRFLVERKRDPGALARAVFLSCVVCWFVNQGLIAAGIAEGYRALICGAAAFLSRDILQALTVMGEQLKKDPLSLLDRWRKR